MLFFLYPDKTSTVNVLNRISYLDCTHVLTSAAALAPAVAAAAAAACILHENAAFTKFRKSPPSGRPCSGQRLNTSWVTTRPLPQVRRRLPSLLLLAPLLRPRRERRVEDEGGVGEICDNEKRLDFFFHKKYSVVKVLGYVMISLKSP